MKVFTCNDFAGFWPVGTAAVIVAKDKAQAADKLMMVLQDKGLAEKNPWQEVHDSLQEVNTKEAKAIVLCDGNY